LGVETGAADGIGSRAHPRSPSAPGADRSRPCTRSGSKGREPARARRAPRVRVSPTLARPGGSAMKNVSRHFARLARSLFRPAPRPAARRPFRPMLEGLEDRALLSTVTFHATDVPQRVDFPDVFTTSALNVPQSLTISSVKVQLDMTYPLDNDLTIDLIAPDGTDVPLSYFEGWGANFQNTTFDDSAATPIWAGNSPFAGSYQPEGSLSALAGGDGQGTRQLQIIRTG